MPAFVKTEADERHWSSAKRIVRKQYSHIAEGSDDFWKLVTGVYKNMSKVVDKKASSGSLTDDQRQSLCKIAGVGQTVGSVGGGLVGGLAGGKVGAAAGAAIGSAVMPGIGTAVGGIVGGLAGGIGGSLGGDYIGGKVGGIFGSKNSQNADTQQPSQSLTDPTNTAAPSTTNKPFAAPGGGFGGFGRIVSTTVQTPSTTKPAPWSTQHNNPQGSTLNPFQGMVIKTASAQYNAVACYNIRKQAAIGALVGAATKLAPKAIGLAGKVAKPLIGAAGEVVGKVGGAVAGKAGQTASTIAGKATTAMKPAMTTVANTAKNVAGRAGTAINNTANAMKPAVTNVANKAKAVGGQVTNNFKTELGKNFSGGMGGFAKDVAKDALVSGGVNAASAGIGALASRGGGQAPQQHLMQRP